MDRLIDSWREAEEVERVYAVNLIKIGILLFLALQSCLRDDGYILACSLWLSLLII